MLKGNHLFQFGGTYQHNFNWHQRTHNGGGINYQPVYELGNGSSGSELSSEFPLCPPRPVPRGNDARIAAAPAQARIQRRGDLPVGRIGVDGQQGRGA